MDPTIVHALVAGGVELLMLPVLVYVINRRLGRRLDDFDTKRDNARYERRKEAEGQRVWQDAITSGMRALLRAEIISEHDRWVRRGYCPLHAREYLQKVVESYHDLGGNDVGDRMYRETLELPHESKEDKQ